MSHTKKHRDRDRDRARIRHRDSVRHRDTSSSHPRNITQRRRDRALRADNFYLWANEKWLREVPKTLPRELKYIRPLDNFKLIQDEMFKNTLTMIRDYTHTESAVARQMKNIFASFRDLHTEPILAHIANFCKLYNDLVCENNLYKFLGVMNQNEMVKWALPVVWNVYPDEYTPGKLSAHIGTPSLSLYDYRFYLADSILEKQMRGVRLNVSTNKVIRQNQKGGAGGGGGGGGTTSADDTEGPEMKTVEYLKYKKRITNAFLRFIDDVFTKCLGRDYETTHNIKVSDVYDIECKILTQMNNLDCRFDESYANIYNSENQSEKPPHLSCGSVPKTTIKHDNCDCVSESGCGADMKERLKLPHYKHNIRGVTRILSQDAMSLVGIDWQEMAKWIGYDTSSSSNVPSYFIVNQVGYLSSIMDLLKKEWASDAWKSYWYFMYLRQLICWHDKWREIYLDFNDTLIRGKDTHFPREYFPIIGLAYAFPKTMTEEFTRRYKNEEMISKVREIGNTMLDCYKARIARNTWMSATTKKGALKKLNTIKLRIGEANLSAPDPSNLEYDPKDAWGNLLKRSIQRTEYIAKHHLSCGDTTRTSHLSAEDLDIMNWGTMKMIGFQSFVVNAYYTPNSNSIYIPTAYMHSMNVQFGRGYEYDLASVGFTFGHEISHALHVNSRIYNHKGVIKNWWSKDDTATYERKIAAIRRQYEEISRKDGFVIDGNLSLSENLADVTGIAVCEDALNKYHRHVYDDVSDITRDEHVRENSFLNFYTYYAIQNRQYANFREILVQVLTNPHLNLKIRTNVPLMRSKTFRDVVGIKKSDKMYNDEFDVVF